jgi:hypothetical protein
MMLNSRWFAATVVATYVQGAAHIREVFGRMGFDDRWVALVYQKLASSFSSSVKLG